MFSNARADGRRDPLPRAPSSPSGNRDGGQPGDRAAHPAWRRDHPCRRGRETDRGAVAVENSEKGPGRSVPDVRGGAVVRASRQPRRHRRRGLGTVKAASREARRRRAAAIFGDWIAVVAADQPQVSPVRCRPTSARRPRKPCRLQPMHSTGQGRSSGGADDISSHGSEHEA